MNWLDRVGEKFDDLFGIGGLDTSEFVIAVESEFGVQLSESVCISAVTVGDLREFLVSATNQETEEIWQRLVPIIADHFGVAHEDVTPQARFVDDLGA